MVFFVSEDIPDSVGEEPAPVVPDSLCVRLYIVDPPFSAKPPAVALLNESSVLCT